jgi:hypothetical protein
MESVYVSIIAVAGTLLGSAITLVLQHRQIDRSARTATIERLRQERIIVYSQFLEAMTAFGGRLILRWTARLDHGPTSAEHRDARLACHEARAVARAAHYRLTLVADETDVVDSADTLMSKTLDILRAADRESFQQATAAVRDATRTFVNAARHQIRDLAYAGRLT